VAHIDFTGHIRRSVEEIISDGDYATEERVQEMIDEVDFEEKVKEVLRNL
jgi:predicted NBD/HSP70 family sugar kinase